MDDNVFYDVRTIPISDRESFNNTILLLTMVKSEYYYIIGFSRNDGVITVGLDFETITEGKITKELTIDFKSSSTEILLSCIVLNLNAYSNKLKYTPEYKTNNFLIENGNLYYVDKIRKDEVIPSSGKTMNAVLLKAKRMISGLLMSIH